MSRTIHNGKGTRLYRIWKIMKTRCYNKNFHKYRRYGGRGITVCEEWKNSFIEFRKWALDNGYAEDLTIDRIDNNGNYEPSNCRWVSIKTQANNRSSCHYITYQGETHTIAEWANIKGLKFNTLISRLNIYHWDIERALNEKTRGRNARRSI